MQVLLLGLPFSPGRAMRSPDPALIRARFFLMLSKRLGFFFISTIPLFAGPIIRFELGCGLDAP